MTLSKEPRRLRDYGRGRYGWSKKSIAYRNRPKPEPWNGPPDLEFRPSQQPLLKYKRNWPVKSTPLPSKFWISITEAASLAGLCPNTFRQRYLRTGKLPYIIKKTRHPINWWIIRRSYIPRAALNELLVGIILSHAQNSEHKIKQKLAVLKGLDAMTADHRVYTTHKPRLLSGEFKWSGYKWRDDNALRPENSGSGDEEPRGD